MNISNSETAIQRVEFEAEIRPQPPLYQPTTAYTQPPVLEQILVVVLFLITEALHSLFVTSAAVVLNSSIMWTLVGVTYCLILLMVYDYLFLTCTDPVDDLILKVEHNYSQ